MILGHYNSHSFSVTGPNSRRKEERSEVVKEMKEGRKGGINGREAGREGGIERTQKYGSQIYCKGG